MVPAFFCGSAGKAADTVHWKMSTEKGTEDYPLGMGGERP